MNDKKSSKWWLQEESPQGNQDLKSKLSDILQGGVVGTAQGLSNLGANIAQAPSDLYSYLSGKKGYEAPRPSFEEYIPESESGKSAEKVSEFLAPLVASPSLAAETLLGKAMFGGRWIPRIATDVISSSAESENRKLGALAGLGSPIIGKIAKEVVTLPKTQYTATRRLRQAEKLAEKRGVKGIPVPLDFHRNLEYQLTGKELRPAKQSINTLLGEAAEGTYPAYRNLQSGLKDISRELRYGTPQQASGIAKYIGNLISRPETTASERLTANQLDKLIQDYIKSGREYLGKTGHADIAELERKGVEDYARHMKAKEAAKKGAKAAVGGGAAYYLAKSLIPKYFYEPNKK
jgi:hypothetical protein